MAVCFDVKFEKRYDKNLDWTKENTSPYIQISDYGSDIAAQRNPNEIVLPMKKIRVKYNYPLSRTVIFEFTADGDCFTRAELIRNICEGYVKIYKEEDDAGHPGTVSKQCLNRAQSHGPYGIWGHDISDLVLHRVSQLEGNLFLLHVDS